MKVRRQKRARVVSDDISPAELAMNVERLHLAPAEYVESVG
jgi:hypothetical protein